MPLYDLHCDACDSDAEVFAPIHLGKQSTNCSCGGMLLRVWRAPAIQRGFQPHFNHSVGRYVTSQGDFKQALAEGSEKMSRRLNGMHVNYEPIPMAELPRTAETEAAEKRLHDEGKLTSKRKIVA